MPKLNDDFKYTQLTKVLERILRDAKNNPTPSRIDEIWLRSKYPIGSNPRTIPSVLKFVKLLNDDGTPTDAWELIKYPTPENKIRFANLIREAYSDIFRDHDNAHTLVGTASLKQIFSARAIGGKEKIQDIVRTFEIFVLFGDFDTKIGTIITHPEVMRAVDELDIAIHAWRQSHDTLASDMKNLGGLRKRLHQISLAANERDPIADAITAAESKLYRSSHVLAWIGFTEFFYRPFSVDSLRVENFKAKTLEELRHASDWNLVTHGGTGTEKKPGLNLYSSTTMKTLQSLVNDRNRCAHGGEFKPELPQTMVFITRIFDMIEFLRTEHGNLWP